MSTLSLLLSTAASSVSPTSPAIFWVSEPLQPGDTAMVAFAQPTQQSASPRNVTIYGRPADSGTWTALATSGCTDYGAAAEIPATFPAGREFSLRVGADGPPFTANRARPWFVFGDGGSFSTPGGYVRVVGDALGLGNASSVTAARLYITVSARQVLTLAARADAGGVNGTKPTRSHAFFDLPASLPAGTYPVAVANCAACPSTPLCTYMRPTEPCRGTVEVKSVAAAAAAWSPKVFTVRAEQPGMGRNATAAVAAAVAAAAANGGGVVYFPSGQYFVQGPIIVAPGTVLRGESRELVSLYFFDETDKTAPDSFVTSSTGGPWGMEGLTVYVTSYANNIVRFQPGTDGGFLRRCRIRFTSCFANGDRYHIGGFVPWKCNVGTAVKLAGRNLVVTDNDIYSSGDVVSSLYSGFGADGVSFLHVARNTFYNGGTTHWGTSWRQSIYEDNVATGVSAWAMGSNYHGYTNAPSTENIYHHNNTQSMVWGNDREMLTTDSGPPSGVYQGGVVPQATATVQLVLAAPAAGAMQGGALCVLAGAATGECRRVLKSGTAASKFSAGWEVDRPFTVPLDGGSHITILPYTGRIAFNGNNYADGGAVQIYGFSEGMQLMENRLTRTGGLICAWARVDGRNGNHTVSWGASFRNSCVDNEVTEGNHVWNYIAGPNHTSDSKYFPYYPGGSKMIEPWFFGSLTNDQGAPNDPGPVFGADLALNRFIVFRGNRVRSHGGFVVRGSSANILVASNRVENSRVGIHVNYTTTQGGIVLVQNELPDGVPANFNPYA